MSNQMVPNSRKTMGVSGRMKAAAGEVSQAIPAAARTTIIREVSA